MIIDDGREKAPWPCMVCGQAWSIHTLEEWRMGCRQDVRLPVGPLKPQAPKDESKKPARTRPRRKHDG